MSVYEEVEKIEAQLKQARDNERNARSEALTGMAEMYRKEALELEKKLAAARKNALEAPFTPSEQALMDAALEKIKRGEVSKSQVRAKIRDLEKTIAQEDKLIARYSRSEKPADVQTVARFEAEKWRLQRLIKMYEHVLKHGEFQKGKRQ